MAGLDERDLKILGNYAEAGNRTLYWNYLARHPGNDGYGVLALGVVRNDNMPGAVANAYAQERVQAVNHRRLSEREWELFGRTLVREDLKMRLAQWDEHRPGLALNLPAKDVQKAHDEAFRQAGLTADAWTPRQALEAARRHGNEAAAEAVWRNMLDSSAWGSQRLARTTADVTAHGYDRPQASAQYVARLGVATGIASQSLSHDDPDKIGTKDSHARYFPSQHAWYEFSRTPGPMGGPTAPRQITDPGELRELNDARGVRMERRQKATEFDPRDPYRKLPLVRSPFTVADAEHSIAPEVQMAVHQGSPTAARGSIGDLFERLCSAAKAGDDEAMRSVTQEYLASDAGQHLLQAGRDRYRLEREPAPEQHRGPVMRM